MKLGTTITRLRKERGLKQKDVAEGAGIAASYLCNIENGFGNPTLDVLELICATLDVPLVAVIALSLEGSDIPESKQAAWKILEPVFVKSCEALTI